ncbi:MAG: oligopeptidase B, partial [Paludibacteraceae bacterium]
MKFKHVLFSAFAFSTIASCTTSKKETAILKQNDFPTPPAAEIMPDTFVNFGQTRVDNYFWMKDKNNPKVIDYLNSENAYTDTVMASTKGLQQKIYDEILGRIKEDDESYPSLSNGYYYYSRTEKGKQYRTYCRKKGNVDAPEEIFFDVNQMAEGKAAYMFGGYSISPDNTKAAYFFNETGSFADYTLKIKDLTSGKDLDFEMKGATSFAWANDNKTVFYGVMDQVTLRPYQVYRQAIGNPKTELVYEEKDPKFTTGVSETKTREWILISSGSSTTSETRFVSADKPMEKFNVFMPRIQDVDYDVYSHKEFFFIRYKDKKNLNGKVYQVAKEDYANRSTWREIIAHDKDVRIEGLGIQKDFLIVETRKNGLAEIEIRNLRNGSKKSVSFPEPVYNAYSNGNPEYEANTFRYSYTSLNRPTSLYEYNCGDNKSTILKQQEVPSGFNPDDYV